MTSPTSPTERVGRYQLLEPIGIGPSGAVSRAKVFGVAGFERQFAIKRFHPELTATAAMAAMLSAAARAYGSLEHPRIARMSEFGVAQGATFTAVELVVGLDALRLIAEAKLAGNQLAAGGALALVSQAARAVGYAHGRGLTHLGLAPTNVIVTADGDIKITDFGILSATLSQRPIEVPRLAQRIPYLAPEQLANEATSAATDVFALGVLAYELVTGSRTFRGDTPQQVAAAIMAGPPAEPALPRPIVRVLQRCLARSPFERFPDARALADALDAALRVAPVPGTRKDIGAQVKETLDRLAALNEGQLSGMVALHTGTGPIRRADEEPRPAAGAPPQSITAPMPAMTAPSIETIAGRPELSLSGLADLEARTTTLQDLPRPMTTMAGLPPPPIPVPPGVADVPIPPPPGQAAPPNIPGASTLLGMTPSTKPALPPIKPRPGPFNVPSVMPPSVHGAPTRNLRMPTQPGTADSPFPIGSASPSAQIDAANDAIHTLDPNDLESIEGDDGDEFETIAAVPTKPFPPVASAPVAVAAVPSAPHALPVERSGRASAAANGAPPAQRPVSTYRLDQSSIDTKPIAPIELEPLLFDPIVRGEEPGEPAADATQAIGSFSSPPAEPAPARELPLNKTMLGFASAAQAARLKPATTPPPADTPSAVESPLQPFGSPLGQPPGPYGEPAYDPPHDEMSELMLEGFRPAPPAGDPDDPAAAGPGTPGWLPETVVGDPMLPINPQAGPAATLVPPPAATLIAAAAPPGDAQLPSGWVMPPPPQPSYPAAQSTAQTRPRPPRRAIWLVISAIGLVALGIGSWQLYLQNSAPAHPGPVAKAPVKPGSATANPPPTGSAAVPTPAGSGSAGSAAAPIGSGSAGSAAAPPPPPPDTLSIDTTPPGARVFLDGADSGTTPVKLTGSADRHNMALLLAGHELYTAQVDGHGSFQIELKEVTPAAGFAGIRVLHCKDKERYYVYVDGKPTGQTCPTERISCLVGPHTVEVYDVVTETRRKWDIVVKDARASFRIRAE